MRSNSRRPVGCPRALRSLRQVLALRPAALAATATSAMLLAAACGPVPAGSAAAGTRTASASASRGPSTAGAQAGTTGSASAGPAASGSATTGTARAPGQPSCDPRRIGPISASFVSATDAYLLGITLSGCAAGASSKVVLRRTSDGGLHWTAVPAPPAPWGGVAPDGTGRIPADGVTAVLFADARDGWAYGPGLWATHDGGVSWHRVDTGGRAVRHMAVTGGWVIASLESCDPADAGCDGPESWVVETSAADRDAWRPVPGAAAGAVHAAQAGTGYAASPGLARNASDVSMFTGPADGSARWVSRPIPCRPGAIALAAVTARHLLLACALPGMHPAATYLYASSDAGAHWQRFAVLGLFDGASTIERAPGGTVLVAGIYDGVELSRDGGRTWTRPAAVDDSDSIQGGGTLTASLVTSEDGYVIGWLGPLWITRDAGRTWAQVPVG